MAAQSMLDKMHSGEIYVPNDEGILQEQMSCLELLYEYNQTRPHEQ